MKTSLLFFLFILSYTSFSQLPDRVWQKTIGGTSDDKLNCFLSTDDGGYLLGGSSSSAISGEKLDSSKGLSDFWIVKLDANRNLEWQKTIGGSQVDELIDMVKSPDGGYLLAGHSNSSVSSDKTEDSFGNFDYWIVKVDEFGDVEWDKTIGGESEDRLSNIIVNNDTSFVISGHSKSDSTGLKTADSRGGYDFWIIEINLEGMILWQKTIGGDNSDMIYSIEKTSDNGFILGGDTESGISGDKATPLTGEWDFWMVKLAEDGNLEWDRSIGGDLQCAFGHVVQTTDGNYVLAGTSNCDIGGIKSEPRYDISAWVLKFSPLGELIWENTIAGQDLDYTMDIKVTSDDGLIIAAYSNSNIGIDKTENSYLDDYWIIKLDESGVIEWENTIQAYGTDHPTKILPISDHEFLVGGYSNSKFKYDKFEGSKGGYDFWFMKLGSCEPIDNSVTIHSFGGINRSLHANAVGDDYDYQWYRCTDSTLVTIAGATASSYYPAYNQYGFYAVRIRQGECENFSLCNYASGILGIEETEIETIHIYPNPTSDLLFIACDPTDEIIILNALGETVLTQKGNEISLKYFESGLYFLFIYDPKGDLKGAAKIIKQ